MLHLNWLNAKYLLLSFSIVLLPKSGTASFRRYDGIVADNQRQISRRALLAAGFAWGCGRKLAKRYHGWLFVASGRDKGVAVANLSDFRRLTKVALPHEPDELFHTQNHVYATSRQGASLIEMDPVSLQISGTMKLPGRPLAARLLPGGKTAILTESPAEFIIVDPGSRRVHSRLALPAPGTAMDIADGFAAAAIPSKNSVALIRVPDCSLTWLTDVGVACGPIRFRGDGKTVLAGAAEARQIVSLDARSGRLLTRLPLPVAPERFCFNADGGQMFVTGAGADAVVIVDPYQNEIGEAILAGRTPLAMAVMKKRNLLFVGNVESGDLTILDIDTRHLTASVHLGQNPGEILITPDDEYALALDRASGDVSVVRIPTVIEHKAGLEGIVNTKPIFTTFATAEDPRSAIIVPHPV